MMDAAYRRARPRSHLKFSSFLKKKQVPTLNWWRVTIVIAATVLLFCFAKFSCFT